jgi:hypothetical protein
MPLGYTHPTPPIKKISKITSFVSFIPDDTHKKPVQSLFAVTVP